LLKRRARRRLLHRNTTIRKPKIRPTDAKYRRICSNKNENLIVVPKFFGNSPLENEKKMPLNRDSLANFPFKGKLFYKKRIFYSEKLSRQKIKHRRKLK
jgi:hypothetical protein